MPPRQSVHPRQVFYIFNRLGADKRRAKRRGEERLSTLQAIKRICREFKIPQKRAGTIYNALWLMQTDWTVHIPDLRSKRKIAKVTTVWHLPAYALPCSSSGVSHMVSHRDVLDIELTRLHADPAASLERMKAYYAIYGVLPGTLDKLVKGDRMLFRS